MLRSLLIPPLIACFLATPVVAQEITQQPLENLNWQTSPEGVAFAALQGDRFQQAYHAMVKLPAGTISPLHTKSATMFGVMVEGDMIHYAQGADPAREVPIGPGGFYVIPAGLAHVSACISRNPCVTYLYQDGPFDFRPVPQ